ncbi:hypothetical protein INR49_015632 [Caranx melampygus]|nr:hypothetical protein INR49_015632 [Caranx melampygus]
MLGRSHTRDNGSCGDRGSGERDSPSGALTQLQQVGSLLLAHQYPAAYAGLVTRELEVCFGFDFNRSSNCVTCGVEFLPLFHAV